MITYGKKNLTDFTATSYLQLNSCGYQDIPKSTFRLVREHGRNDHQLLYVQNGWIYATIANSSRQVSAGQCVYYKNNDIQDYCYPAEGKPKVYWLHFTGTVIEEILNSLGLTVSCILTLAFPSRFEELLRLLLSTHTLKNCLQEENVLLLRLLTLLMSPAFGKKAGKQESNNAIWDNTHDSIYAIADYLCEHYRESHSIQKLATMANLSTSRFSHLFKLIAGCSPYHFLQKYRLDMAREYPLTTNLSISAIAEDIGFDSEGYFSRIFKKYYGCSPREYRKRASSLPL